MDGARPLAQETKFTKCVCFSWKQDLKASKTDDPVVRVLKDLTTPFLHTLYKLHLQNATKASITALLLLTVDLSISIENCLLCYFFQLVGFLHQLIFHQFFSESIHLHEFIGKVFRILDES